MREILFLAHRIPWPADRGDKIRSHHILRHLAAMAPVHVAAFADDDRDMGFVAEMEPNFASVHAELRNKPQMRAGLEALVARLPVSVSSFASDRMADHIDALLASEKISHVFCFSGQMAQYIPKGFGGRFIMDFVDVDSAKFESYAAQGNPLMRWVNAREGRLLSAFEHDVAARADVSLFVSEAEAALFRQRSGLSSDRVTALGNGIDVVYYDPDAAIPGLAKNVGGPLIVFTGQMDYRPNIEAVTDFALNAMPEISKAHPSAIFAIVGRNPAAAVSALGSDKAVIVTGAVDDVRSWLKAADVVVAPLRIARGIQNKVLEAMAMAKPVVVSPAAAEGIDAQDGKHFRIAADVFAEARMVSELLSDVTAAKNLGKNARQHVSANYAWESQLAALQEMMEPRAGLAAGELAASASLEAAQ
jgi:polysaccharide biosynthesis protein PslH